MDDFVLVLHGRNRDLGITSSFLVVLRIMIWKYLFLLEVKNKDLKGNVARVIKYI